MDPYSHPAEIKYFKRGLFFKNTYFIFSSFILLPFLKCAFNSLQATNHTFPSALKLLGCVKFPIPISLVKIPRKDL